MSKHTHHLVLHVLALAYITGQSAGAEVTLVRNGKPTATIVIPDITNEDSDNPELPGNAAVIAAKELRKFIARASGAKLPIRVATKAPSDGTLVLVGRSSISDRFNIAVPSESEGVRIKTFPRGIAILGEIAAKGTNNRPYPYDRGTLHAAYIFLEKYVGFRFYFRRGSQADLGLVVPNKKTITLGAIDFASAPAFPYRAIVPYSGTGNWKAATRPGRATDFTCNHTHFGWEGLYRKTHPEYFSLGVNGKRNYRFLCYSHPDVLQRELQHTNMYYRTGRRVGGNPGPKYIPVEPADNWMECRCKRCQSLIQPNRGRFGRHSRLWWDHYIRQLGMAVKQRWPNKRVAALAYQGRIQPGDEPLPANVDVQVCIHNAPLNFYKEANARREIRSLLGAWSKKLAGDRSRLYVWDYTCYPQYWSCAPTIYPHTLQQFLRDHRKRIGGLFINGGDETIQADHYMVAVTFALLWNPDLDVDAHLRDYCRKFFGPAAGPMEQVYRLMIERYEQTPWPSYSPSRYASYAPPTMFYGRTYTQPVVEQIEQLLCQAEESTGQIPGGRVTEFVGEGWMLRRNHARKSRAFEITLEASDRPVESPTVKWNGGQLTYRGTLVRGQQLVVRPGRQARLLPAKPRPADELIPFDRRLAGGLRKFSNGYVVHTARSLRVPAFPGAMFRIQIAGKAASGGNSFVAVQWSTGQWSYHMRNKFDAQPRIASEVITAPPKAKHLNHVYFYRADKKGTVWYGDLSLRREFAEPKSGLGKKGKDVSALIDGDAPAVPAQTSRVFHVYSRRSDSASTLRVGIGPIGSTISPKAKPTIYQRRVAWMRDGWENFHPRHSMYRTHDGFLVAAHIAHRWLGRTPRYVVSKVNASPPFDLSAGVWQRAPKTTLVRGRSRATVPVDNLGFDAGTGGTEVRMVHDDRSIYVTFRCRQPEKMNDSDSVTFALYRRNKQMVKVTCRPTKKPAGNTHGLTWQTRSEEGGWTAFITIPKSAIRGLSAECRADLSRNRRGRSYVWSPHLSAPWSNTPPGRRGRLVFKR